MVESAIRLDRISHLVRCRTVLFTTPENADKSAIASRREWLRGFSGLCGLLSLGIAFGCASDEPRQQDVEDWLLRRGTAVPASLLALRPLGETYLATHPGEAVRERLQRLLLPDGWTGGVVSGLIRNVARDWTNHDVTAVSGWVLARTEARLCGLIFLTGTAQA
jgi:hypothetical protein